MADTLASTRILKIQRGQNQTALARQSLNDLETPCLIFSCVCSNIAYVFQCPLLVALQSTAITSARLS
jgi:hypothetical protein